MEVKAAGCSPCWGVSPDHSPEALPGPCLPQAQALLTPVHSQQLRQGSVLIKQSLSFASLEQMPFLLSSVFLCVVQDVFVTWSPSQVRLNSEECADVLKRWVDHLCSPQVNQKSKALLVLLSLGCFSSVAETLHRYTRVSRGWSGGPCLITPYSRGSVGWVVGLHVWCERRSIYLRFITKPRENGRVLVYSFLIWSRSYVVFLPTY